MKRASQKISLLAQRLIALHKAGDKAPGAQVRAAERVCEKLRMPLTKLAGEAGYASLLSRALALAQAEVPAIGVLTVRADGSLDGFNDVPGHSDAEAGGAVLVSTLLQLLVTFIGEPLTLRLVQDAWQGAFVNGEFSSNEEQP